MLIILIICCKLDIIPDLYPLPMHPQGSSQRSADKQYRHGHQIEARSPQCQKHIDVVWCVLQNKP